MRTLALAAGLFSLLAAGAAQAQVHKCVDASGKTVYSQSPCPKGVKSQVIKTDPPPAAAASSSKDGKDGKGDKSAKAKPTPEAEFRKRQTEQQESEKKANEELAAAKNKQEQCERARSNLAQMETGGRVARLNAKGEREILDDRQMEAEKPKARELVQKWCG